MRAPFPYFGGKSRVADEVWDRLGDVPNYVEPFAGSLAVLLARPHAPRTETVNDADAYLCNFWRAIQADPEAVACYADWPVNETDLEARHWWLVTTGKERLERLRWDADYFDAKAAGWWVWGLCAWIGSGWCEGKGPHFPPSIPQVGASLTRKRPHLGNAGQGIHRQLPHLGDAGQESIGRLRPMLGGNGQGVGVHRVGMEAGGLLEWFAVLSERLRRVRVCCGDWTRVLGPSPTFKHGLTGVFLDPPYLQSERARNLYRVETSISAAVRDWAIANGPNPLLRIALCGYEGEHEMPPDWECFAWKAKGGFGGQSQQHDNPNADLERIWFSPSCLRSDRPRALTLWEDGS
jgi:hypothetical protein